LLQLARPSRLLVRLPLGAAWYSLMGRPSTMLAKSVNEGIKPVGLLPSG